MSNRITVDVTPGAFRSENPNAEKNIANANAAGKRLEDVIRGKADLLERLVVDFGGISGLASALRQQKNAEADCDDVDGYISDFVEEAERLTTEHADAGKALVDALRGV